LWLVAHTKSLLCAENKAVGFPDDFQKEN